MNSSKNLKDSNRKEPAGIATPVQQQNAELISAIVKIREALGQSSLASSLLGLDEEIDLSLFTTRVVHSLLHSFNRPKIKTWRNLVTKSENDIMRYRNVGKVAVEEIKEILQSKGWHPDMTFPDDNSIGDKK